MKMNTCLFMALIVFLFSQSVIAEPEMVFVKGGCFEMGNTFGEGDKDEKRLHEVCLDDFYIGKYEVTQREWVEIMGENPSKFKGCDDCPVESVSYDDAGKYIIKLKEKTGKNYSLPTEAQWEYAARSGGKKELWAGTSDELKLKDYAWYKDNSDESVHPVGQKEPNGLGIYDMSGNVWEHVSDRYDKKYYKRSPRDNPKGPSSGKYTVQRGGGGYFNSGYLRVANRGGNEPGNKTPFLGFRLTLSAK